MFSFCFVDSTDAQVELQQNSTQVELKQNSTQEEFSQNLARDDLKQNYAMEKLKQKLNPVISDLEFLAAQPDDPLHSQTGKIYDRGDHKLMVMNGMVLVEKIKEEEKIRM